MADRGRVVVASCRLGRPSIANGSGRRGGGPSERDGLPPDVGWGALKLEAQKENAVAGVCVLGPARVTGLVVTGDAKTKR